MCPLGATPSAIWLDAGCGTNEPARARVGILSNVFVVVLQHYDKPPASLLTQRVIPVLPSGPLTAAAAAIYSRAVVFVGQRNLVGMALHCLLPLQHYDVVSLVL